MEITRSPQQAHVHLPRFVDDPENQTCGRQRNGTRKPSSDWFSQAWCWTSFSTLLKSKTMTTHYLEKKPRLTNHDSVDSREPLDPTDPTVGEPDSASSAALASLLRRRNRTGGRRSMRDHQGQSEKFRDELLEGLAALMQPGCSVLFLCQGKQEDCHIIPVAIKDSADPSEQWNQAQQTWYSGRGLLRSIFHWYRVKSIEMAEITIAGRLSQHKHQPGQLDGYAGLYQAEDLRRKICELEGQGTEYYNNSFYCDLDTTYMCRRHVNECPSTLGEHGPAWECPYTAHDEARRDLAKLKRRPILKLIFRDPDLANFNLSMDELGLLISHQDLLRKVNQKPCPKLEELLFPGLVIHEEGLINEVRLTLPLLAGATLSISVVIAWLIYGDWAVAWQVGGCFLALTRF